MSDFTAKITRLASGRKWQVVVLSEITCDILFTNDRLPCIRAIKADTKAQFILSLGTPGKYLVPDMSEFRHEISNLLLYRNSIKEGFWSIFETRTPTGIKYFPGYTRVIEEQSVDSSTFNEVMNDIISEFNQIN